MKKLGLKLVYVPFAGEFIAAERADKEIVALLFVSFSSDILL